jgi:vancomycin resistance protein YoaR
MGILLAMEQYEKIVVKGVGAIFHNLIVAPMSRMVSSKSILVLALGLVLGTGATISVWAARQEPRIRANTMVGPVEVGGLTSEEAMKKLRVWWESQRRLEKTVVSSVVPNLPKLTPGALGLTLDDEASVADAPIVSALQAIGSSPAETLKIPLKYKSNGAVPSNLIKQVNARAKKGVVPARAIFQKGVIVRKSEQVANAVDESALYQAVLVAMETEQPVELPMTEAPKHVPDEALKQISEVVASFTTPFQASNRNRSTNLKVAASNFSGQVLMPGDTISFNKTVGERTISTGFREAIIYSEGRHEPGVGGGICQVSSTLYNAWLFANLKIAERHNHMMSVPYVPYGRDATVYWGSKDLVLENSSDSPVAIHAEYLPGKLTFRVLGKKTPGVSVKVVTANHASGPGRVQTVRDPNLPAGKSRVTERGSGSHSCVTYRYVYQDGTLVNKEFLNRSSYSGGVTVVSVGAKAPTKPPTSPSVTSNAPPL